MPTTGGLLHRKPGIIQLNTLPTVDWSHPLSRGLVWCWFPGISGIINITGLTGPGSVYTPPLGLADSPGGKGANFTGTQGVNLPVIPLIDNGTPGQGYLGVTSIVWVYPKSLSNSYSTLYNKRGTGYTNFYLKSTGTIALYTDQTGADPWPASGGPVLSINNPYMVAFCSGRTVANPGNFTGYYVNGVQAAAITTGNYAAPNAGAVIQIGYDSGSAGRLLIGALFHAHRIYNRILSPDEIAALYQDPLAGLIFPQQRLQLWATATAPSGFTRSLAESLGTADSDQRTMAATRTDAETSTAADHLLLGTARTLAESTHPADALTSLMAATRSLAETASVLDHLLTGNARALPESTHAADALSSALAATRTLAETASALDHLLTGTARSSAESAHPADTLAAVLHTARSLGETLAAADHLIIGNTKIAAESAAASDVLSRTMTAQRTIGEIVGVLDHLSLGTMRPRPETIAAIDTVTPGMAAAHTLLETLTIADHLHVGTLRPLHETLTILDAISATTAATRSLIEALAVHDSAVLHAAYASVGEYLYPRDHLDVSIYVPIQIIASTIEQLRTYCPLLGGRVAGAADFRQGLQNYNATMPLPAAYVVPIGSDSEGNTSMVGLYQFVRETIAVIVEFDATPDRRGQVPVMDTEAMGRCLNSALLNWLPARCITQNQQGYWLSGSRFLDLDRARLFYQWEYSLNTILDDTDAWQIPSVPLESIEVDIFKVPPQDMEIDQPPAIIKIPTADPPADPTWPFPNGEDTT